MKLREDLIKELISNVIGQDAVPLVFYIKDKENVSEIKLAEKLGITVNEVRNILYRLSANDLVSSTRKKDMKKGWYNYFWTLDHLKAMNLLIDYKRGKINNLNNILLQEQNSSFFKCPSGCTRLSNEQALEYEFKCPECNKLLEHEDKIKKIEGIKNEIKRLEGELKELSEITIEKVKVKEKKEKVLKKKIKRFKPKIKTKKRLKKKIKIKEKIKPIQKPLHKPIILPKKEKLSILKRVKRKLFKR